jgi:tetratricopeptide (TPR) repeat protein
MLLYAGLYHADGQIQDEVYAFGSFTQSKMYHKGVRCTDCHDAHSLELKYEGNRLCAQCHQPGKYDAVGHHHHPNAVDGAAETQCVTCHMPTTTYMGIDERRDHSIRVPRPDLTVKLGTPNVCNRCHTKPQEDAAWAAAAVEGWYGPQRPDDPHYAAAIAAGRAGKAEGDELLRELMQRGGVPDIVRATAVSLLAGYPTDASERARREATRDPSPLVRTAAARALTIDTPARLIRDVAPMLDDSARAVRMAAAARLVSAAPLLAQTEFRGALDEAIAEYRAGQAMHLDRADAHLSLATLDDQLGDIAGAIKSLRSAILVEPYRSGARGELARLLDVVLTEPAHEALRARLKVDAEEIRRLRVEEIDLLARDAELLPGDPQPRYRRGLLLFLLGELDAAREAMKDACQVDPKFYEGWMALALIAERQQNWDDADLAIRAMMALQPDAEDWKAVLQRMAATVRAQRAKDAAQAPHSESLSPEEAAEGADADGSGD